MEKWNGKVAIVTGASAGIGDAIVRDLVKYGINVVALARRIERLEKLKEDLKDAKGKVIPVKCDVSSKESIDAAFKEIEEKANVVHILVNNAGIVQHTGIFNYEDSTDEQLTSVIDTNITGLVRVSREAYRLMKKSEEHGIIINIGSVAGHIVPNIENFLFNVYPGTKHAVRAITESMRQELIKKNDLKVRVCEISPGGVHTEIGDDMMNKPEFKAIMESGNFPILKSSNIAQTVLFMLMVPYEVNITEMIVKPVGEKI